MLEPHDIDGLCRDHGWTRTRLIRSLRLAADARGTALPGDESLRRMVRQWASGQRRPSAMYRELLGDVFGAPFSTDGPDRQPAKASDLGEELQDRLALTSVVDHEVVALLDGQTDCIRGLDRRFGAAWLHQQTRSHVDQMADLLTYSTAGTPRTALARALAEAACLAAWQALDLGDLRGAWLLHEQARIAAGDAGDAAVLAHVTAQQACVLLDLGRHDQASAVVRGAIAEAGTRVPRVLRAWLWALLAETRSAAGDAGSTRRALDRAQQLLTTAPCDPLPYVFLDAVHLTRWQGHCLARLGAAEAIDDLTRAAAALDGSFVRAAASLRCDLVMALAVAGHHEAAIAEAERARTLARRTGSRRQQVRLEAALVGAGLGTASPPSADG